MAIVAASLNLDAINALIHVTDTTDYVGQALDPTLAQGFISIYGVALYDNIGGVTPDILPAIDTTNTSVIDLPLDSDGNPANGQYILTYVVLYDTGGPAEATYSFSQTFTLDYTPPTISIETEQSCTASTLRSTDATNYGTATITLRVHTITPPTVGPPPTYAPYPTQTVAGNINTYTGISTGTWQASIVSTINQVFEAGFDLDITIGGLVAVDISCDTALCTITCCLYTLRADAIALERRSGVNNPYVQQAWAKINEVEQLIVFYLLAERCGNTTKTAFYLTEIQRVSGCDENCSCSSGQIIPIIPASPTGTTYNVDSPLGTIDVVTEVTGNLTTFHIEVSEAIIDIINNFQNTDITSVDGSVTITSNTVGILTTFDLSVNASASNSNRMYIKARIYHNPAWATPGQNQWLIETFEYQNTGIALQNPVYGLGQNNPNVLTDTAVIGVSNFWATGVPVDSIFTPQSNVIKYIDTTDGVDYTIIKSVEAEIYSFEDDGTFIIRLWNPSKSGQPLLLSDLDVDLEYWLQISIHADDAIVIP